MLPTGLVLDALQGTCVKAPANASLEIARYAGATVGPVIAGVLAASLARVRRSWRTRALSQRLPSHPRRFGCVGQDVGYGVGPTPEARPEREEIYSRDPYFRPPRGDDAREGATGHGQDIIRDVTTLRHG